MIPLFLTSLRRRVQTTGAVAFTLLLGACTATTEPGDTSSSASVGQDPSSLSASSEATQSSVPATPSSIAQSSIAQSSSSDSGAGEGSADTAFERGRKIYYGEGEYAELACSTCHGDNGEGLPGRAPRSFLECKNSADSVIASRCSTVTALSSYTESAMPIGQGEKCVGQCASDLAVFMGEAFLNIETSLSCDNGIERSSPVRRLNIGEMVRSFNDIFGAGGEEFEAMPEASDNVVRGFATVGTRLSTQYTWTEQYLDVALAAVSKAVDSNSFNPSCDANNTNCFVNAMAGKGKLLFRRPLTSTEITTLRSVFEEAKSTAGTAQDGVKAGLLSMVISPKFLFLKAEKNETLRDLTGPEVADKLALALTGATPDEELIDIAIAGELKGAVLEQQIERLLDSPKFERFILAFGKGWIGVGESGDKFQPNSIGMSNEHWQALREDMAKESALFIKHIIDNNLPVNEFLLADYSFLNARLAAHYGIDVPELADYDPTPVLVDPPQGDQCNTTAQCRNTYANATDCKDSASSNSVCMCGNQRCDGWTSGGNTGDSNVDNSMFVKATLPASSNRRGMMTQGTFLTLATQEETVSYVERGKLILSAVTCQDLHAPMDLGDAIQSQLNSNATQKEKMASRLGDNACSSCHVLMDPIGWSLTEFGAAAQPVAQDPDGDPLSIAGSVFGESYDHAAEMSAVLASRDKMAACFASKFLVYAVARDISFDVQEDKCAIEAAVSKAEKTNGTVGTRDLLKSLLTSDISTKAGTITVAQ